MNDAGKMFLNILAFILLIMVCAGIYEGVQVPAFLD